MLNNPRLVDLTHTLSTTTPTWDGSCGFESPVKTDYSECTPPNLFRIQRLSCNAGIGTHIDAPAHVIPNGRTVEELTLEELVTNCVVLDLSSEVDEDYIIMPTVIERFEKDHGRIAANSFVIFRTGWDAFWETPSRYHNDHRFPSVHPTTAERLLERQIAGIGTDTLSCDRGNNGFPVHNIILGANKYLVENVANAKLLPPTGAKVFALPMKFVGGTEAPIRLIARL